MVKRDWDTAYKEKGEIQTWVSYIVQEAIELLKQRNCKKILDLGFGTGRHTIFLAEKGFDVYGIDISEKGKEITEKKVKEKNLTNVHLKIADMHDLPFKDNSFDAVIATYIIHHNKLAGLNKTVSEIKRVLKPKGLFIGMLISTKDLRYGAGKEIEPNTFIDIEDVDSDVPHHFSDEKKVKELFADFNFIKLHERKSFSKRRNVDSVHWEIIAEKK